MDFFKIRKDGGPDSNVTGYWLIEWKAGFSIALLRFSEGSRENFHSHAFNAWSWILSGALWEDLGDMRSRYLLPSFLPVFTGRDRLHRVHGLHTASWALTFRGPWSKTWIERTPDGEVVTLANGRRRL